MERRGKTNRIISANTPALISEVLTEPERLRGEPLVVRENFPKNLIRHQVRYNHPIRCPKPDCLQRASQFVTGAESTSYAFLDGDTSYSAHHHQIKQRLGPGF